MGSPVLGKLGVAVAWPDGTGRAFCCVVVSNQLYPSFSFIWCAVLWHLGEEQTHEPYSPNYSALISVGPLGKSLPQVIL